MTTELAIRILTGDVLGTSEQTHEAVEMAIQALSAQPERKRGKWIKQYDEDCWWYECSECGRYPLKSSYGDDRLSSWCPHCGAEMVKGEEDDTE